MLKLLFKAFFYLLVFLILVGAFIYTKEQIFTLLAKYDLYKPSHQDNTSMDINIEGGEDSVVKIYEERLTKKVKEIVTKIEEKQKLDEKNFKTDLQNLLNYDFNDSYNSVDAFADWFYAYTTQYNILYQGAIGIVDKYRAGLNGFSLTEAARENINYYISTHYKDIVLKPNLLEPKLKLHLEQLFFRYIKQKDQFMKSIDDEFIEFLILSKKELSSLKSKQSIDWKSNIDNIKSILSLKNKEGEGGIFTIATISALSAKIGSKVLTSKASTSVAGKIIAKSSLNKMIASLSAKLAGGTFSAGVGFIVGGVLDYSVNKADELANRDTFIKDVKESLNNIKEIIFYEIDKQELIKQLFIRDINSYKLFINNK